MKERTSRRWSPEMITATAAVFIGVFALFVSLYETHLVREHQRASVWPHLEGGTSWDGQTFRVLALNSGIGPARVEGVMVRVGGEVVRNWGELLAEARVPIRSFIMSQFSGRVLLPGDPLEALVVTDPEMAAAAQDLWADVVLETCYCSIFDECWVTNSDRNLRREVRTCPAWGESAFRN